MMYLVLSFIIFLVFTIYHVFFHRLFATAGVRTMKTAVIFLPGLLIDIYLNYSLSLPPDKEVLSFWDGIWFVPIPLSAIVFYLLLTAALLIFYAHPAMNFISPSAMILRLLEEKKMTRKELFNHFSDNKLIDNRLSDLEKSGLIKKEEGRVKATDKGKKLILFRTYFRKIFGMRREE